MRRVEVAPDDPRLWRLSNELPFIADTIRRGFMYNMIDMGRMLFPVEPLPKGATLTYWDDDAKREKEDRS